MRRLLAALLLALSSAACGPPVQNGGVFVLPGATERLILAMRMGYRGAGEAKPSADVRVASSSDDLVGGSGASGKVGDLVLENEQVVAIVAAIDGTDRGGTLVDFARNPSRDDELAHLATSVLGHPVRYTTLKTGTDAATGAAYVEVSGTSGSVAVSTRYDLAPELDALLVHTSFTRPAVDAPAGAAGAGFDVDDSISLAGAAPVRFDAAPRSLAVYGGAASYVVVPLVEADPSAIGTSPPAERSATIGLAAGRATEGAFVYSRFVAPLERSDSLSLDAALAVADGRELGDVEIEVAPERWSSGLAIHPGRVLFRSRGTHDAPAHEVVLDLDKPIRAGDRVTAKVPSGRWEVSFDGDDFRSRAPVRLDVRPRVVNDVRVPTERVPTPASMPLPPNEAVSAPSAAPPTDADTGSPSR